MAPTIDYFAILGISEDVSAQEIEARYRELADYLSSPAIPAHLQGWAAKQAALVDEAYAVLSDPERRAAPRGEPRPSAEAGPDAALREEPSAKAKRRAPLPRAPRVGAGAAGRPPPSRLDRVLGGRSRPLLLGIVIGVLVLSAVLLGRYAFLGGGGGGATEPGERNGAGVALDTQRISELMAAVQDSPNDAELLFELGERFFQANEWESAIEWFTRLLEVEPDNVHARTDIGTANFNLGWYEEAKAAWLAVLEIDPDDAQAHYNLGFLYANAEPQDLESARREWQRVIELAPDSDLATTAQVHLESLLEEPEVEALPTPP